MKSIEWNTFDPEVKHSSPQREGSEGLLSDQDMAEIEAAHAEGLTSAQIVELFRSRGIRLSEATFRKYVQLGLLPRSRRVGRKGKHQGSMGLYPSTVVRRVNAIKQMMAESYTIEEIQRSFLRFKDEIETLELGLRKLFAGFEREVRAPEFDAARKKKLTREIDDAKKLADDMVGWI